MIISMNIKDSSMAQLNLSTPTLKTVWEAGLFSALSYISGF